MNTSASPLPWRTKEAASGEQILNHMTVNYAIGGKD